MERALWCFLETCRVCCALSLYLKLNNAVHEMAARIGLCSKDRPLKPPERRSAWMHDHQYQFWEYSQFWRVKEAAQWLIHGMQVFSRKFTPIARIVHFEVGEMNSSYYGTR